MIKEELVEYVTSFLNEENEAEFNLEIDALNYFIIIRLKDYIRLTSCF